jgi:hypothetical protein
MSKNSLTLNHNDLVADKPLSDRELNFKGEVEELTEVNAKKLLVNIYRNTKNNIQRIEIQKAVRGLK